MMTTLRSRLSVLRATPQAGVTMTEMVVAMVMLSIVITGALSLTHALGGQFAKDKALTASSAAAASAFLRLEKQVRYATGINTSAVVTKSGVTSAYVEMLVDTEGADTCVQWRLNSTTDQLQVRQWADGGTAPATFTTVARDVVNNPADSAAAPFTFSAANTETSLQSLTVLLQLKPVRDQPEVTRRTTFLARNSAKSDGSAVCKDTSGEVPRP